jgi:hypothetical protein
VCHPFSSFLLFDSSSSIKEQKTGFHGIQIINIFIILLNLAEREKQHEQKFENFNKRRAI